MTAGGGRAVFAAQLRHEFDHAFSLPPQSEAAPARHLLAIRVGGAGYALELADIAGIQLDRPIVPAPGPLPEWLGLAGIRGELVPVYSLAMLLGYAKPAATQVRWLVLCGSDRRVGLAFEAFEGHLNLTPGQIAATNPANDSNEHVRTTAHADAVSRPVVSVESVMSGITKRCSALSASKEK